MIDEKKCSKLETIQKLSCIRVVFIICAKKIGTDNVELVSSGPFYSLWRNSILLVLEKFKSHVRIAIRKYVVL